MTAIAACRTCGTEPLENARFCHGCGAPVTERDTHAEYKQVTVLFADVVHSMDIAATVGAERLREIMTELVNCATSVVQRYGGTVDKFTGDGIMAVFGAPAALEDHAIRACLAALDMQQDASQLATEVGRRDGVILQLRVGLNSGQVIAGEIGSGAFGYTAIGEQVGMAQRMESVAPPGGVMLSESTARLVEGAAALGTPEMVRVKGIEDAVSARRLLGMAAQPQRTGPSYSKLVGREWELATLVAMLDRSMEGRGSVVGVAGRPGIGKTRLAREAVQLATSRGVEVFFTFCESHATDVPFRVVARLLRAIGQVSGLDDQTARARVRVLFPDADPQDLLLLDDLLGIADPEVVLPKIDADARRRRLTALINTAQLARTQPAIFVVEDAHWIDKASESMLSDFVAVIPRTHSLVLATYRPEYEGALARVHGAQTIALAPLSDSETAALVSQLLGLDPSVGVLGQKIAERAAGNPFFAEEMVRELAERSVLHGERGSYVSTADVSEVSVPATLQATIGARIDRLDPKAKRTLSAAAVIGSRFSLELLATLGIEPIVEDLVGAEFVDQVRFTGQPEYVFHHPLIRTVAYESQLKSDRAELHRRVAGAIESGDTAAAEENAALIAEHLQAAGDLHAAYGWHMRAASWASNRDIAAARLSWEHAQKIADDALPADDPKRAAMRIAPRTMLCGTAWRVHERVAGARFDELQELCAAAGDKASLAIATAGLVMDHVFQDRVREASQLASEAWALAESIGDPALTVALSTAAIHAKGKSGEWCDVLRWSQRVIDLADGDPTTGSFIFGCPLALAHHARAIARLWLGRPGWRDDLRLGLAMARSVGPAAYPAVVSSVYCRGISDGVLRPDDFAIGEIEDAIQHAERSGDNLALAAARMTLGVALVHRQTAAERDCGRTVLAEVRDAFLRGPNLSELPIVNLYMARERARDGDRDEAITLMRAAADHQFRQEQLLPWGIPATAVLVETLLDRGGERDVAEAEAAIERLAAAPADEGLVIREIWLLRLRALLARAHGDAADYADLRDRYRDMAKTLGFEGHIAWAEAMP
jgi:class 3 adenylate cyclase